MWEFKVTIRWKVKERVWSAELLNDLARQTSPGDQSPPIGRPSDCRLSSTSWTALSMKVRKCRATSTTILIFFKGSIYVFRKERAQCFDGLYRRFPEIQALARMRTGKRQNLLVTTAPRMHQIRNMFVRVRMISPFPENSPAP